MLYMNHDFFGPIELIIYSFDSRYFNKTYLDIKNLYNKKINH